MSTIFRLLFFLLTTTFTLSQLTNSSIHVKTNHLETHPHTLQDFKDQLAGKPVAGYCERDLTNLYTISNRHWCYRGKDNLIIFYVNVTFGVGVKANYSFDLPSNFGLGGYSLMDGEIQVTEKANLANTRELNFW